MRSEADVFKPVRGCLARAPIASDSEKDAAAGVNALVEILGCLQIDEQTNNLVSSGFAQSEPLGSASQWFACGNPYSGSHLLLDVLPIKL